MSLPIIKSSLSKLLLSKNVSLALLTSLALIACSPAAENGDVNDEVVDAPQTEAINNTTNEVSRETATEQDNVAAIEQPITILALGDSLTEGLGVDPDANYPAQLEAKLKEMGYTNVEVVNSGLSGETSTGLVNRLDWVTQTNPDITILTIGANDAIRGIDVATIEDNIRTAVKHLQDNGSEVILGGMQIYDNLGNDYVKSFSAIYPRIAEDMNLQMIPFFLAGVGGVADLNQADAIHPTKDGYTIIVNDNILPILKPELERMTTSDSITSTDLSLPATTNKPTETS